MLYNMFFGGMVLYLHRKKSKKTNRFPQRVENKKAEL